MEEHLGTMRKRTPCSIWAEVVRGGVATSSRGGRRRQWWRRLSGRGVLNEIAEMDLGRSYEPDGARNREDTHRGDGSMVWVRRRRSVWAGAGRDGGAGVPGESEGFGLRLWVWRLGVVWRVSWREGSIYRRGRTGRQARGVVAKCSASLGCAGGGRRGTRLAAGVGFAQGLQRGCRGSQREPGAVGLALSLRASALAGGGGYGLATAAAVVGFAGGRHGGRGVCFADAGQWLSRRRQQRSGSSRLVAPGRGAASVGRGGCEGSAGRGRASGRGGAEASSALHSLAARFAGRGGMGGLGATTFGSHPMCSMKCLQGKRWERGGRDGVLGHWQVGSRVLGPTDQRSTGIGEVRNISSQGFFFLERAEGLTNFFWNGYTAQKHAPIALEVTVVVNSIWPLFEIFLMCSYFF
jgi:hypothetical protein